MTLALVVPGPLDRRSGGYSYDVDLVEHLKSLGHEVEVWNLPAKAQGRTLAERLQRGVDTVIFDALVHAPVTALLERLRPRAKGRWLALVHHLAWLDRPAHRGTGRAKALEKRFLALMDGYLFNSENTAQTVRDLRGDAPFLPSLICRPPLNPAPPTTVTGQGRLLFLGNVLERKNLHGLIEALSSLTPPWTLTVAGSETMDAAYARRCRRLAARRGVAERIVWRGRVEGQELERLWAETDLFTLPSFHEGWGMAHAEALARGIPSLAVAQGGVLEVLGDAALWCAPEPASLAQGLRRYFEPGVRDDLAVKARHRGAALPAQTGFAALGAFLEALEAPEHVEPEFSFTVYLEAKAAVDDRSLHPRVFEAAFAETPRRVVELGGGTGTMARRLRALNRLGPDTDYLLVDQDEISLERASRCAALFDAGKFQTRRSDLRAFADTGADLVIAHALLDLFDPRSAAPWLASLGARRYWLTHLFDGLSSWEPLIDAPLDEALMNAYHASMAERAPGGAQGSPRSGRDWLTELPKAGLTVVDAASSDWIAREPVFLRSILHFFQSSLGGRADVDQAGLAWWLKVRRRQVEAGEATFIAHQFDLVAQPSSERRRP